MRSKPTAVGPGDHFAVGFDALCAAMRTASPGSLSERLLLIRQLMDGLDLVFATGLERLERSGSRGRRRRREQRLIAALRNRRINVGRPTVSWLTTAELLRLQERRLAR